MQTVAANSTAHLCYFAASHTLSTTAWSESATVAAGLLRGVRALRPIYWGALVAAALACSLAALLFWPWPQPWAFRSDPSLAMVVGLAAPGVATLVLAHALVAVSSVEPVVPALSLLAAALLGTLGAGLAVYCHETFCEPPLPPAFDSRALVPTTLAAAVLCLWVWARDMVRRQRGRRGSLQASLIGGGTADSVAASGAGGESGVDPERRRQEIAITALRFIDGFSDSIPSVALRQFAVQPPPAGLGGSPAAQAVIFGIIGVLPWNFNFVAAFISDTFPICGRRRVPYMIIGLCGQMLAWGLMGLLPGNLLAFAGLVFLRYTFAMLWVVMCDTVTVECMNKWERGTDKGKLQSDCSLWQTIGTLSGGLIGGWMLEYWPRFSYKAMFRVRAVLTVPELVLVAFLSDPKVNAKEEGGAEDESESKSLLGKEGHDKVREERDGVVKQNIRVIWSSMHEYRIWRPMIFVFVFSLAPGNGDGFNSFLLGNPALRAGQTCAADDPICPNTTDIPFCLDSPTCPPEPPFWPADRPPLFFTDADYAYVNFIASCGSIGGILIFKRYLRQAAWRPMFAIVITVSVGLSMLQLILIYGINQQWGVPNLLFAMGDDLIQTVAEEFINMPMNIMMSLMVPDGAEGTVFALVNSLQTVGSSTSGAISAVLTASLGITLTDFSTLGTLTIVTGLAKLIALPFIFLVPRSVDFAKSDQRRSVWGAVALATVLFGGIGWSVGTAIYKLAAGEF